MEMKDLEILKFKMIAYVKTYEMEFRKMKSRLNDVENENKVLKKKISMMQKRRMSAANVENIENNKGCLLIDKAYK